GGGGFEGRGDARPALNEFGDIKTAQAGSQVIPARCIVAATRGCRKESVRAALGRAGLANGGVIPGGDIAEGGFAGGILRERVEGVVRLTKAGATKLLADQSQHAGEGRR